LIGSAQLLSRLNNFPSPKIAAELNVPHALEVSIILDMTMYWLASWLSMSEKFGLAPKVFIDSKVAQTADFELNPKFCSLGKMVRHESQSRFGDNDLTAC
jgi:hypothetical protein